MQENYEKHRESTVFDRGHSVSHSNPPAPQLMILLLMKSVTFNVYILHPEDNLHLKNI